MKKIVISLIIALICFFVSFVFFNDISFPFLGLGIVSMGFCLYFFINRHD